MDMYTCIHGFDKTWDTTMPPHSWWDTTMPPHSWWDTTMPPQVTGEEVDECCNYMYQVLRF